MSGSDAELRSRAEELAYLEQRFDIHVMAFADQSDATARALQLAFKVDRATAEHMLVSTPVVVKRGATPEVAGALLDELNRLGAQVVLLPSDKKGTAPAKPEARAPMAPKVNAEPGSATAWGGLDLQLAPPPTRAPALPSERPRRPNSAELEESLDEPDAPADEPSEPPDPEAELELPPSDSLPRPLQLHASAPPPVRMRPRDRGDSWDLEVDASAGVEELEPSALSLPPQLPVVPAPQARPPKRPATPGAPPPPPAPALNTLRASELGLGTVPPLPPLSPLSPRQARAEFAPLQPSLGPPPAVSTAGQGGRARKPTAPGAAAPGSPRAHGTPAPRPKSAARSPDAKRVARGAKSSEPRLKTAAEPTRGGDKRGGRPDTQSGLPVRPAFERDPFPAPALPERGAAFPVPPKQPSAGREPSRAVETPKRADVPQAKEAAPPREEPPARGLSLLMITGSLLGLYLGVYVEDSVLHGSASLLSIALHGVVLFGLGRGLAGLRS